MSRITRTKNWLAQVNPTSWHYRFVEFWEVPLPKKACTYYWVCLPRAFLSASLYSSVGVVSVLIGLFSGFTPDLSMKEGHLWFPYKTRKDGTRRRFVPWEAAALIGATWVVARIPVVTVRVATVVLFCVVAYYGIRTVARFTRKHWDEVCPDLMVK